MSLDTVDDLIDPAFLDFEFANTLIEVSAIEKRANTFRVNDRALPDIDMSPAIISSYVRHDFIE